MSKIKPVTSTFSSGEEVLVRAAIESDASGRVELYRSVVEEGQHTLVSPGEFDLTEEEERSSIKAAAARDDSLCLTALVDGGVVGALSADTGEHSTTAHFCDIKNVWVHADWRRKGVGSLLMETTVKWAEAEPAIEKLGLFVFSTSTAARRLYEKHGFQVEGRGVHDMKFGPGQYADTIIMGRFVES